jgi:ribosome production factor 2
VGDEWERSTELQGLRSLILDIFAARDATGASLPGLDHVIQVSHADKTVHFRGYYLHKLRSGMRVPRAELMPMGPNIDFSVRRTQFAPSDVMREALRVPAQLRKKKTKNVSTDVLGETRGQLHMERQDFGKLTLRKAGAYKAGLKRQREEDDEEEGEAEAEEDDEPVVDDE